MSRKSSWLEEKKNGVGENTNIMMLALLERAFLGSSFVVWVGHFELNGRF